MDDILVNVNWLAVLVGAALAFGLGMLWFGPLFGKAWALGSHDIKPPEKMPVGAIALQLLGTFLLSWIIGATASINALMTALLVLLALSALMTAGALFSLKSMKAALIDGSFVLAMGVLMIGAQGVL